MTDNASGLSAASLLCPLCSGVRRECFQARLLRKYDVRYLHCATCGLLQTEAPYWLNEAYSSVIAASDTGLVARNLEIADRLTALLYFCFDSRARYLDLAGGYGLLARLMRDRGFDFYWHDPYCSNLFARGFEWENVAQADRNSAVTAFEVLEHVPDPLKFFRDALQQGGASTVIFSTQLYEGVPPPDSWWYYSLDTGQHISFFRHDTLVMLASKLNLNLYTHGWLHVLTTERISRPKFRLCASRLASVFNVVVRRRMRPRVLDDHSRERS